MTVVVELLRLPRCLVARVHATSLRAQCRGDSLGQRDLSSMRAASVRRYSHTVLDRSRSAFFHAGRPQWALPLVWSFLSLHMENITLSATARCGEYRSRISSAVMICASTSDTKYT